MISYLKSAVLFALMPLATHLLAQEYYQLPELGYAQNALQPAIDEQTMRIHYTGHHRGYVEKLNKLLQDHLELKDVPLTQSTEYECGSQDLRNQAGGHINHTFFWRCMTPDTASREIPQDLLAQIRKDFGSLEACKQQFDKAASTVFGSGWAWLTWNARTKKLAITTTSNQNNPLSQGLMPLLALDVWEHAYYLRYFNQRASYIEGWWTVVNWEFVAQAYRQARQGTCILNTLVEATRVPRSRVPAGTDQTSPTP
jgi:Fe-Mn family superoxide dismutase